MDESGIFRYMILGPLAARKGNKEATLSRKRARGVLACLVLDAGKYVHVESIIDRIYGEREIRSSLNQVHRGVGELRRQGIPVETMGSLYRLDADREDMDCYRFLDLCEQAASARAGADLNRAARIYEQALALWRGPALADLDSMEFSLAADFWNERRMDANEARMEVELARGHHREVIPEIRAAQAQYPFQEELSRKLMLACYRSGRSTEALQVFSKLKTDLAESLGTSPGPELEKLHLRILRQDPGLQKQL